MENSSSSSSSSSLAVGSLKTDDTTKTSDKDPIIETSEAKEPKAPPPPLVIVLAGPTGVGKSAVAAQLCRAETASQWGCAVGHVVSADSVQAYQGVEIGSNKPTPAELEQTPHHLINVVNASVDTYSAADWMRDALHVILRLRLANDKDETLGDDYNHNNNNDAVTTTPLDHDAFQQRRALIDQEIAAARARTVGNGSPSLPILPVVVGGTMMYLQWLVHGRPDAMKPTPEASQRAHAIVQSYFLDKLANDNDNDNEEERERRQGQVWQQAVAYASSLGPVFAQRMETLASNDWYRLRRTLEIAFTVLGERAAMPVDSTAAPAADHASLPPNDNANNNKNNNNDSDEAAAAAADAAAAQLEALFSGERHGGLDRRKREFDLRCFFLCPNDRMAHTQVVDQRCEEMLLRGLLSETARLWTEGQLPLHGQTARAIGYRQALAYLRRPSPQPGNGPALEKFLQDFCAATRRYAKKQMQWFRRDDAFVFCPVQLEDAPNVRVEAAAAEIVRLCQLPREEFDQQRTAQDGTWARTKHDNEAQGKGMKFYVPQPHRIVQGTNDYTNLLNEADKCTAQVQNIVFTTTSSSSSSSSQQETRPCDE